MPTSWLKHTIVLVALLFASQVMQSQQTATTNCSTYSNTANCTTNTAYYSAQQQRAYQTSLAVGNALGQDIPKAMQAHSLNRGAKKYCEAHPGGDFVWKDGDGQIMFPGHCPSEEVQQAIAANEFVAHHLNYKRCAANAKAINAYFDTHKLDPREKKSYEHAYNDMKKTGQLELYAK
jgi:hypothetical protein